MAWTSPLHTESNLFRRRPFTRRTTENQIMQVRANRYIGNGLLHRWGMATSPQCPHCTRGPYDSGSHTLCACCDPIISGLRTHRHDDATHAIVEAINKAHHERPFSLRVSAGRRFQESNDTLTCTIPHWALPDCRLTPDLVLILGWDDSMPPPTSPSADVEFVIADVTYGQGDTATARAQRKQDKYAQLVANWDGKYGIRDNYKLIISVFAAWRL